MHVHCNVLSHLYSIWHTKTRERDCHIHYLLSTMSLETITKSIFLLALQNPRWCHKDCGCVSQPSRFCDSGMIGMTRCNRKWCDRCDVVVKRILFVKKNHLQYFVCQDFNFDCLLEIWFTK